MSTFDGVTWHLGADGNVYTGEIGGERVAIVEDGSTNLREQVFGETNADGVYPSLKPCRGRLIAVAPNLLAAVKELLHWATLDDDRALPEPIPDDQLGDELRAAVERARAAINKAEGR